MKEEGPNVGDSFSKVAFTERGCNTLASFEETPASEMST